MIYPSNKKYIHEIINIKLELVKTLCHTLCTHNVTGYYDNVILTKLIKLSQENHLEFSEEIIGYFPNMYLPQ